MAYLLPTIFRTIPYVCRLISYLPGSQWSVLIFRTSTVSYEEMLGCWALKHNHYTWLFLKFFSYWGGSCIGPHSFLIALHTSIVFLLYAFCYDVQQLNKCDQWVFIGSSVFWKIKYFNICLLLCSLSLFLFLSVCWLWIFFPPFYLF